MSFDAFQPILLALKFRPRPTLVVEYVKINSNEKIRRNIKLNSQTEDVDIDILTDLIIRKNVDILGPDLVDRNQIFSLVEVLIKNSSSTFLNQGNATRIDNNLDKFGDLNKASDVSE